MTGFIENIKTSAYTHSYINIKIMSNVDYLCVYTTTSVQRPHVLVMLDLSPISAMLKSNQDFFQNKIMDGKINDFFCSKDNTIYNLNAICHIIFNYISSSNG